MSTACGRSLLTTGSHLLFLSAATRWDAVRSASGEREGRRERLILLRARRRDLKGGVHGAVPGAGGLG
jgi:hypothetical protein